MPLDRNERLTHPWFGHSFPVSRTALAEFGAGTLPPLAYLSGPEEVQVSRLWADRINASRDFARPDVRPAKAGEIAAMALLQDILRYIVDDYAVRHNAQVLKRARKAAAGREGDTKASELQEEFTAQFPPEPLLGKLGGEVEFLLEGGAGPLANVDRAVREILLLRIANGNPAIKTYRSLFDERPLERDTIYRAYVAALNTFFRNEPPHPESGLNLIDTLWEPILRSPDDIEGQLNFVRSHWAAWLPGELVQRMLLTHGLLREERTQRGHGPGPATALSFGSGIGGYPEYEAFSIDKEWMPNVVLMAKSTYVWLDQLSKRYQRPINRLDEIPDEELDQLARWGFTSLWLIGLWERSIASKTIKRMTGNPEAESSAYSLYDYTIAWDLGGEAAYRNLAARAWLRGIRLASDMVPNHVGIYSRWIVEHPDWFIQSDHPPFPGYTFTGADLSSDPHITLQIEDGYWNRSDAAVVFKHYDHRNGQTRYIYHGNDGTSMPWNDTAQLNYLLPQVREAVAETILHVARMFPVIRFDAAMTLAKKHYQRLWFPKPGDAGAIPSRAEHGMSQDEFDRVFPVEFWREVVDRVAAEAPDTLLLAEAFWLMEGYFVRTLGMHRVYNSAFMNMLKMEENAKFRLTVKNVLEYSPPILQRFVNFMNNPDEDTAEAQFGKGDKYFGVATLLVTMPGLPMLGHGQVEGLTEKYGMEYRRAYRDEPVDTALVRRHEHEIFPLMRRRHIFSGAEHFAFYDFVLPEGSVNENVFAYSNRTDTERALVVYNNALDNVHGRIRISTAINDGPAETPDLRQRNLADALGLDLAENCYYIYRDCRTGLEYIEHARRISDFGMHFRLDGYAYQALIDWRAVHDTDLSWGRLHMRLAGQGVPSISDAYMEMVLAPILDPFRELVTPANLEAFCDGETSPELDALYLAFVEACGKHCELTPPAGAMRKAFDDTLAAVRNFDAIVDDIQDDDLREALAAVAPADQKLLFAAWALLRPLGMIGVGADATSARIAATSAAWMHEWFLTRQLARSFDIALKDAWRSANAAALVRCMIRNEHGLLDLTEHAWGPYLDSLASDPDTCQVMRVNHFGGRRWLNKEGLDELLAHTLAAALISASANKDTRFRDEALILAWDDAQTMAAAASDVNYDLDWWLDALK